MPNVLWPIFQQNRNLLYDLPALAGEVVQQWVKAKYGIRVLVMVVQHTFGRRLNFHPHLPIMVSNGGVEELEVRWIPPLHLDTRALMHMCKHSQLDGYGVTLSL